MRRTDTRAWKATAAALAVLAGAACGLAFTQPSVRVAQVSLASMTLTGGTLLVSLDVENPNRYALESQAFRYTVAFAEGSPDGEAWVTLARGELPDTVRIPGGGTGRVDLRVPFETASLGAAMGRLLRQGELEYRFSGELRAGTPLGAKRIPFDQRGLFRP